MRKPRIVSKDRKLAERKFARDQRMRNLALERLFPETGDRLWAYRESRGMTQKEMAEDVSVSAGCISRIECGYTMGYSKTIANMCRVLGISADFLFNLSDSEKIHDPVVPTRRKAL